MILLVIPSTCFCSSLRSRCCLSSCAILSCKRGVLLTQRLQALRFTGVLTHLGAARRGATEKAKHQEKAETEEAGAGDMGVSWLHGSCRSGRWSACRRRRRTNMEPTGPGVAGQQSGQPRAGSSTGHPSPATRTGGRQCVSQLRSRRRRLTGHETRCRARPTPASSAPTVADCAGSEGRWWFVQRTHPGHPLALDFPSPGKSYRKRVKSAESEGKIVGGADDGHLQLTSGYSRSWLGLVSFITPRSAVRPRPPIPTSMTTGIGAPVAPIPFFSAPPVAARVTAPRPKPSSRVSPSP